jgi:hypothetical protein
VVETVGLENRCTRKGTGGSNPSPSATRLDCRESAHSAGSKRYPHFYNSHPGSAPEKRPVTRSIVASVSLFSGGRERSPI